MPEVIYVRPDGERRVLKAVIGESVMHVARRHMLPGIAGDCGGELSCATCHVFVDPAWAAALPARSASEEDMLECTAEEPTSNSRLACQIRMNDTLDGLVVHLPRTQS